MVSTKGTVDINVEYLALKLEFEWTVPREQYSMKNWRTEKDNG